MRSSFPPSNFPGWSWSHEIEQEESKQSADKGQVGDDESTLRVDSFQVVDSPLQQFNERHQYHHPGTEGESESQQSLSWTFHDNAENAAEGGRKPRGGSEQESSRQVSLQFPAPYGCWTFARNGLFRGVY